MRPQIQPSRWSCLPTAFAIVLDVDVKAIFYYLGHDGSDILWPHLEEPFKRKAFHIQELVRYSFFIGYAAIGIDLEPKSTGIDEDELLEKLANALKENEPKKAIKYLEDIQQGAVNIEIAFDRVGLLIENSGVLIGQTDNGRNHAVAWEANQIYDPNGTTYSINNFFIREFYILKRLVT